MIDLITAMKIVLPIVIAFTLIGFMVAIVKNLIEEFLSTRFGSGITLLSIIVFILVNQSAI